MQTKGLQTLAKISSVETEEKKSRFITHLVPYKNFEEQLALLRTQHRKASTHCTAFRHITVNDQVVESAKDDGEPAGTAGTPMLRVLQGENLIDVGVIVVRYFDGTKLGTGGLARAYGGGVSAAIAAANLKTWHRILQRDFEAEFAGASALEQQIDALALRVVERQFTDKGAVLTVEGPEQNLDILSARRMNPFGNNS